MTLTGLSTIDLRKKAHTQAELQQIIDVNAPNVQGGLDGRKLLMTIARLESGFGQDCRPRFEPAYYPGGLYFKKSKDLQTAFDQWGALVSFSYGPFQIMWVVAFERGYIAAQPPLDLWSGAVSCPYVVNYLNHCMSKGAKQLDSILACYNGGLGAMKNQNDQVKKYVLRGLSIYQSL